MDPANGNLSVTILSENTRQVLSDLLNSKKIIKTKTSEKLSRDWRGLSYLCNVHIPTHREHNDPTKEILSVWGNQPDATINNLFHYLEKLDRYDIIDDVEGLIKIDIENNSKTVAKQVPETFDVITLDDIGRNQSGLGPQRYDAMVLYADNEIDIALTLVNELKKYNFKFFLKDFDLAPGIIFEQQAFMKLIRERCDKVLIILSPEFIKTPLNGFLHSFAMAVSMEDMQKRKVIPCIYKFQSDADIPLEYRIYTKLYYKEINSRYSELTFWNRLRTSIAPDMRPGITRNGVRIQEISESENNELNVLLNTQSVDHNAEISTVEKCQQLVVAQINSNLNAPQNIHSVGYNTEEVPVEGRQQLTVPQINCDIVVMDKEMEQVILASENKLKGKRQTGLISKHLRNLFSNFKSSRSKTSKNNCPILAN
ncbi:myeloid differentiation primary response protein MyD88 [Lycorma delicatula]|uniref:myeloid differentiation primary response protein MyD88 n=1 Tax=Lycorma delicatula TaxID=130591 RepID=UPI003F519AB8